MKELFQFVLSLAFVAGGSVLLLSSPRDYDPAKSYSVPGGRGMGSHMESGSQSNRDEPERIGLNRVIGTVIAAAGVYSIWASLRRKKNSGLMFPISRRPNQSSQPAPRRG